MTAAAVLPTDEVDVWVASLEGIEVESVSHLLAPEERTASFRLREERDRRRFVARRGLRRIILAGYVNQDPADLEFAQGEHGKPELAWSSFQFSCSHSRSLAIVAVTNGRRVGADVEWVRPVPQARTIAAELFGLAEAESLGAESPRRGDEAFLVRWTRLEAQAKARGAGLGPFIDGGGRAAWEEWSQEAFRPAAGYVGAVAAEGEGWRLRCRWW